MSGSVAGRDALSARNFLLGAALAGAVAGAGSTAGGRQALGMLAHSILSGPGATRLRVPQAGDFWAGCNEARAAGAAPLFRGEPGYRVEMDGDGDGIACEPYRGQ